MELQDIVSKLKSNSHITLSNGQKIKLSDIQSIDSLVSMDDIYHKCGSIFTVDVGTVSLEIFISNLKQDRATILSNTLNFKEALEPKSAKVIRENSKWIWQQVILQTPMLFTEVYFNKYKYFVETLEKLQSLISFINDKRPIADILGMNDGKELWWHRLDSDVRDQLLSTPVNVTAIYSQTNNSKEYYKYMATLFNIPQATIELIKSYNDETPCKHED